LFFSGEWYDSVERLQAVTHGLSENVFALGLELLGCRAASEAVPSKRVLAGRAGMNEHYVGGYKRILGYLAPDLFGDLLSPRAGELGHLFADRRDEWSAEMLELCGLHLGKAKFAVALEMRARAFLEPPGAMPTVQELAARAGVDERRAAALLEELRNHETLRSLEKQARWSEIEAEVEQLQRDFPGPRFDVAGEMLLGRLRGEEAKDEDIARATGIPLGTVSDNRRAVSAVVGRILPPPAHRGRGRPRKDAPR
jgi:hypothetical protein